jgi:hypothetical protein
MVKIRDNKTNKNTADVRFCDTEGKKETTARLSFSKTITNVSITDLLENETTNTTKQVNEKEEFDIKIIDNHIIEV